MKDVVDSLLLRLAKTNKGGPSPSCRLCGATSEASDLCDECVTSELSKHVGEDQAKFLAGSMIQLRRCNKVLDQLEEDLKRTKEKLDAI